MRARAPILAAVLVLLLAQGAPCADKTAAAQPVATAPAEKLDLNRASVDELLAVPGIGPRMAQAIVDLRTARGSFSSLDELLQVRGIKEKTLKSITPYLALAAPPSPSPSKAR